VLAWLMTTKMTPITSAELSVPIRIAHCCLRGVAPDEVARFEESCEVQPAFDAATQTIGCEPRSPPAGRRR